jgi:hypothetical protein
MPGANTSSPRPYPTSLLIHAPPACRLLFRLPSFSQVNFGLSTEVKPRQSRPVLDPYTTRITCPPFPRSTMGSTEVKPRQSRPTRLRAPRLRSASRLGVIYISVMILLDLDIGVYRSRYRRLRSASRLGVIYIMIWLCAWWTETHVTLKEMIWLCA